MEIRRVISYNEYIFRLRGVNMIFGKDIAKYCAFCEYSSDLKTNDEMVCIHRGIVDKAFTCKKFKYDPLKREPVSKPKLKEYSDKTFSLQD